MGGISKELRTLVDELMDNIKADLMQRLSDFVKGVEDRLINLETENNKLREQVRDIRAYSKGDSIEISNIPISENENVEDIVIKVNKAYGVEITNQEISHCYRVPLAKNYKGTNPPKIYVKYVRRITRNSMLKEKSTVVKLKDIGMASDKKVFISEALTHEQKQLYFKALDKKKELSYKYLWTKNGKIYMRYMDNSKTKLIASLSDLEQLEAQHSTQHQAQGLRDTHTKRFTRSSVTA